jgi:hypothetical protein
VPAAFEVRTSCPTTSHGTYRDCPWPGWLPAGEGLLLTYSGSFGPVCGVAGPASPAAASMNSLTLRMNA